MPNGPRLAAGPGGGPTLRSSPWPTSACSPARTRRGAVRSPVPGRCRRRCWSASPATPSSPGVIFADGKPLYHGASVRTATGAQWRMLIARDGGCIGCGAHHAQCQAHHIVPYARSRRTDIDNLVLVCWRCHHNIHDHHWRVVHHNGKPALQPPDPSAPPNPAGGPHPDDTRDAPASRPHPPPGDRGSQHARPGGGTGARISPLAGEIRARDRTRRPDNANAHQRQTQKASDPDPPPQTPALFTT